MLLLLAVVIALIGIANTLALSIFERTRELGLLRAVGMTRPQLRSSVRWESVIIALLGTLLGSDRRTLLRLGRRRGAEGRGHLEFALPAGQLIAIVVIGALAGALAAVAPARARRQARRAAGGVEPSSGYSPNCLRTPSSFSRTASASSSWNRTIDCEQRGVGGAEDAHREQAGVAGVADADGRDGDAARHLHDRQQRVEPVELVAAAPARR